MNIRLIDVREAIESNDIERVNGLLRRLFNKVVVDVKEQTVSTQWVGR